MWCSGLLSESSEHVHYRLLLLTSPGSFQVSRRGGFCFSFVVLQGILKQISITRMKAPHSHRLELSTEIKTGRRQLTWKKIQLLLLLAMIKRLVTPEHNFSLHKGTCILGVAAPHMQCWWIIFALPQSNNFSCLHPNVGKAGCQQFMCRSSSDCGLEEDEQKWLHHEHYKLNIWESEHRLN